MVVLAGLFALCVGLTLRSARYEQRRSKRLAHEASELGWRFTDTAGAGELADLADLPLFGQSRARRVINLITDSATGVRLRLFDYHFEADGGDGWISWLQTVVVLEAADLDLVPFVLRPRNVFDKLGGVPGLAALDLSGSPSFSRDYLLKSANHEWATQKFGEAVQACFVGLGSISAEGQGQRLVCYRPTRRVGAWEIRGLLAEVNALYQLLRLTAAPVP